MGSFRPSRLFRCFTGNHSSNHFTWLSFIKEISVTDSSGAFDLMRQQLIRLSINANLAMKRISKTWL